MYNFEEKEYVLSLYPMGMAASQMTHTEAHSEPCGSFILFGGEGEKVNFIWNHC